MSTFLRIAISMLLIFAVAGSARAQSTVEIVQGTYAHSMSDSFEPIDPTDSFLRGQTIFLCLEFRGQGLSGMVNARFMLGEEEITSAEVDLSTVGRDESRPDLNTTVGFTLNQVQKFPLGEQYHTDIYHDGAYLGSWFYRIVAPDTALPSLIREVTLSSGVDSAYHPIDRRNVFAPDETVHLVGIGDSGVDTWLQAEWAIGGQVDDRGTRSLTMLEDKKDNAFTFYYLPEGGWPKGEQTVILKMNGREICRLPFMIR